jgi:hypothetical protein
MENINERDVLIELSREDIDKSLDKLIPARVK